MIHIKDDIYIDADETQFILLRMTGRIDKKTGKEAKDFIGYYPTFAQAVKGYCKMAQRQDIIDKPDRELVDAFFDFETIVRELEELLNKTEVSDGNV